jgi:hypothetical protein
MQRINFIVRILIDDVWMNEVWLSLGLASVECLETVQRETTWKTSNGAKQTFECLGKRMTDVVFVDLLSVSHFIWIYLNHRPPRAFFILKTCFSTDSDNLTVIRTTCHKPIQ